MSEKMSAIYQHVARLDNKSIFYYTVLFMICVLYFNNKNITGGTFLGIIFASVLIYFIIGKNEVDHTNQDVQHESKLKSITPMPTHIGEYSEITDFIFSIQDFYMYNPPAFEEMILFTDRFLATYKEVRIDAGLSGIKYGILNKFRSNAVNALHSIIYMLPANKLMTEKHATSVKTLFALLDSYVTDVYNMNKDNIKTYGYRNDTVLLNTYEIPANTYEKNISTYEFV